MNTKKPSAIVYGWPVSGTIAIRSDIYFEEHLYDDVIIHSLEYKDSVIEDYSFYKPDLIISINNDINVPSKALREISIVYNYEIPGNILANDIVCQSTFRNSNLTRPKFSIFTPTYETHSIKIDRLYNSLIKQTVDDWEWVIMDDSASEYVWKKITKLAEKDYRVKPHRIFPLTEGNIGMAKYRAATLCSGEWLVEVDHDDALISDCLEMISKASNFYKECGFIYTDCCELYDNGEFKSYDHGRDENWYGRPDNYYCWGYAGHTMVDADEKRYLAHHSPDINPRTIRFNIGMPNHARAWKRDLYFKIGGHNSKFPVADDFELIIRTFLNTRMIHIKEMLYLQYSDKNTTTDNNVIDINRRARLIRDHYNNRIHQRIIDLGGTDWDWNDQTGETPKFQFTGKENLKFGIEEKYLNYVYSKKH